MSRCKTPRDGSSLPPGGLYSRFLVRLWVVVPGMFSLKTTPRCPPFSRHAVPPHHRYGQRAGLTPVRCRHGRMPHPGDRRTRFLLNKRSLRSRRRRGTQIQQPKGSYSQVKVRNLLPIQIQRSSDGWVVYYNHTYLPRAWQLPTGF